MSLMPARKKRRLSPPELRNDIPSPSSSDSDAEQIFGEDFANRAAKWNLEQDYEQKPRQHKTGKENLRLPIKTADGRIQRVDAPTAQDEKRGILDSPPLSEDEEPQREARQPEQHEEHPIKTLTREEIIQKKEELARIAGLLSEDPEQNIRSLNTLQEITSIQNPTLVKLGLATQMTVYKDIIPGYRIRALTEDDMRAKVTKEVRKLRAFEQAIVRGYQKYVADLGRIATMNEEGNEENSNLVSVAVSCACSLLNAVPHFNFRAELLKILVEQMRRGRKTERFQKCIESIQQLFVEDEDGHASHEAVSLLSKMIKDRRFRVDEEILNTFLHLRLLIEFSQKGSNKKVDQAHEGSTMSKKFKEKREFRTKRERKMLKERKGIEKEMKEADAVVSHEQREHLQGEILKLVFGVYLRILKARTPKLMGPVLEGLVKYAHLINQDFFGDLLESLRDIVHEIEIPLDEESLDSVGDTGQEGQSVSRNVTRESLLCVTTAYSLLIGQEGDVAAKTLDLDLSFFNSHLYRTFYQVALNPDLEASYKPLQRSSDDGKPDAKATRKVNVQTTIVLLLRSLQAVLLPTHTRSVPPVRLAAFAKQIMTSCLNMPEKSCTAMLGLMNQIMKTHRRKINALWSTEERKGDGVFDSLRGEPEGSNPFATNVWEGELLRLHFAPSVRNGVGNLEKAVMEE